MKKRTSQGLEQTAEKHKTKQLKMALNHKDHNIEHRSRDTLSRISSERLSIWSGLNTTERLWLEGIQLKPEANNKLYFLPLRLCFINIYTYPNPKPTPYNNAKTVIIVVQSDKHYAILICACPVVLAVYPLALTQLKITQTSSLFTYSEENVSGDCTKPGVVWQLLRCCYAAAWQSLCCYAVAKLFCRV